jgi:hypothetical protein
MNTDECDEPVLQTWLPSSDAREYLPWICAFLAEERGNILLPDGPDGTILILDPPGTLQDPDLVRVTLDEALAVWDEMLRRVGREDAAFEISAGDGGGAVLTRWECSPEPR